MFKTFLVSMMCEVEKREVLTAVRVSGMKDFKKWAKDKYILGWRDVSEHDVTTCVMNAKINAGVDLLPLGRPSRATRKEIIGRGVGPWIQPRKEER